MEYFTPRGKRDFVDVIKLEVLRWGDYMDYPVGPITNVLERKRQGSQRQRRKCDNGISERIGDYPAGLETEEETTNQRIR